MSFRPATGRKIQVKWTPRTSRDLIRRHLREEGKTIVRDLASWWDMHPNSAYRRMYDKRRPMTPGYIEAVIEGCKLDEFDANELRILGAIEAGWNINPKLQVLA